ncbi:MAG: dioxygenase [Candidatus Neomarinimicrobiota bacterium]|nr:MAG: dioxygenase [Candidatus Neomarinimicrobiota bacterium]
MDAPDPFPVVFLPHGGGPLPLLDDPQHASLVAALRSLRSSLPEPEALIVVSAHWEAETVRVTSSPRPGLVYDYYGFPDAAYSIQYDAPGNPDLARDLVAACTAAGLTAQADPDRPFDHGMFVPLKLLFPEARIPCVQVSLLWSLDPQEHLRLGEALRPFRSRKILILGSGFTFHNPRAFLYGSRPLHNENMPFEDWLYRTLHMETDYQRAAAALVAWDQAPQARFCHPREEHFLPLLVCAGAGGVPAERWFFDSVLTVTTSGYIWRSAS